MLIFEAAKLDAWVLEIGMGGRLDAVNIVDPTVAVVVSIGLDHQEFLGSTLEDIAREKAGIFRRGVPAVLGSRDMPAGARAHRHAARRAAQALGARVRVHRARGPAGAIEGTRWDLSDLPPPALRGEAQFRNAAAALAALEALHPAHRRIPRSHCARAHAKSGWWRAFRSSRPRARPSSWTWHTIRLRRRCSPRIYARCRPRDERWRYAAFWATRMPPASRRRSPIASTNGGSPRRKVPAVRVARNWPRESRPRSAAHASMRSRTSLRHAPRAAAAALPGDRVVIFGSFHTVGPAMDWLEARGCAASPRGRANILCAHDGTTSQGTPDRRQCAGGADRADRSGDAFRSEAAAVGGAAHPRVTRVQPHRLRRFGDQHGDGAARRRTGCIGGCAAICRRRCIGRCVGGGGGERRGGRRCIRECAARARGADELAAHRHDVASAGTRRRAFRGSLRAPRRIDA